MAILVTGGAGYIGSICVEELLAEGHEVVVIDNLQEGHREALMAKAVFYEGDFGDRSMLDRIFREREIDAVMHFAADTKVEESMRDPGRYFLNNAAKGIALLDAMLAARCRRIIFSSTAAVFGEPQYIPVDEGHPLAPVNPYGESKLFFERILHWYNQSRGIAFIVLRYFNAAGATERFGDAHRKPTLLIPVIMEALLGKRESLRINGRDYPTDDGTCVRDYIHVKDIARAHVLALDRIDEHPQSLFNLGNGRGFTNLQVLRTVEEVTGRTVPFDMGPRRAGDPAVLVASSDQARNKLGWAPAHVRLEDIVRSAWEWRRTHPDGYKK
ncbi:MAG: UDP-glucose 4-epimerase GalE [Deltaproteobacteria bacterium]|nr:UDP-glucose 4-epimerase GalE [Deltaproteobacteria bacterium]